MKEGNVPHPGNTLNHGSQLGQIGRFRGSEERAPASLQQAEERETSTEGPCPSCTPLPRYALAGVHRGWARKLRFLWTDLRRRLGLAHRYTLKGQECGISCKQECLQGETDPPIEALLFQLGYGGHGARHHNLCLLTVGGLHL